MPKTSSADHSLIVLRRHERVGPARPFPLPAVAAPFADVSMHVMEAERIRLFLTDRMTVVLADCRSVFSEPAVLGKQRPVVAKAVNGLRASAAGEFPLRIGWQCVFPVTREVARVSLSRCQFGAERHRVIPTEVRGGKVGSFFQ